MPSAQRGMPSGRCAFDGVRFAPNHFSDCVLRCFSLIDCTGLIIKYLNFLLMLVYIPGFPPLYLHMFKQRKAFFKKQKVRPASCCPACFLFTSKVIFLALLCYSAPVAILVVG
jgi:hypothetical protein